MSDSDICDCICGLIFCSCGSGCLDSDCFDEFNCDCCKCDCSGSNCCNCFGNGGDNNGDVANYWLCFYSSSRSNTNTGSCWCCCCCDNSAPRVNKTEYKERKTSRWKRFKEGLKFWKKKEEEEEKPTAGEIDHEMAHIDTYPHKFGQPPEMSLPLPMRMEMMDWDSRRLHWHRHEPNWHRHGAKY